MFLKRHSITQWLRPPSLCALCQQYHRGTLAICIPCHDLFHPLGPACQQCAQPLPDTSFLLCGHCCKEKPFFDQTFTGYVFKEPLRSLLHTFKYQESLYLSTFFASLILNVLTTEAKKTECLIPVPMHRQRLQQRGFNPSAELVKHLAHQLKIPYDLFRCKKVINTLPQAGLNANQRHKNLKHSFIASPLPYQHVTIVDDLMTTGSTSHELAKTLKQQGVSRVDVWCCARVVGTLDYQQNLNHFN